MKLSLFVLVGTLFFALMGNTAEARRGRRSGGGYSPCRTGNCPQSNNGYQTCRGGNCPQTNNGNQTCRGGNCPQNYSTSVTPPCQGPNCRQNYTTSIPESQPQQQTGSNCTCGPNGQCGGTCQNCQCQGRGSQKGTCQGGGQCEQIQEVNGYTPLTGRPGQDYTVTQVDGQPVKEGAIGYKFVQDAPNQPSHVQWICTGPNGTPVVCETGNPTEPRGNGNQPKGNTLQDAPPPPVEPDHGPVPPQSPTLPVREPYSPLPEQQGVKTEGAKKVAPPPPVEPGPVDRLGEDSPEFSMVKPPVTQHRPETPKTQTQQSNPIPQTDFDLESFVARLANGQKFVVKITTNQNCDLCKQMQKSNALGKLAKNGYVTQEVVIPRYNGSFYYRGSKPQGMKISFSEVPFIIIGTKDDAGDVRVQAHTTAYTKARIEQQFNGSMKWTNTGTY